MVDEKRSRLAGRGGISKVSPNSGGDPRWRCETAVRNPIRDFPKSRCAFGPQSRTCNVMQLTVEFLSWIAKLLSGASVRWVDCHPDTCQRVYFANHTSHLDALVVWACLPPPVRRLTRPVAAQDYWEKTALRRYLARSFDALLIDRKEVKVHNSPIDMMIREVGDRGSLIVFPEGHRNTTGELGEFKSGLYYLSKKRPDFELVPVHIDNLNRVLPRGEFLPVPLLSCITFGPPMWLEQGESKMQFLQRAQNAVRRLKEI